MTSQRPKPNLRVIDCRSLPKPVSSDTVSVLRVLLAKAEAGEVSGMACIYDGPEEHGALLTGDFRDQPERLACEALRVSIAHALTENE
jgi:hypothetical protein